MEQEIVKTIFGLLGGLAVFLFGMNMMSEGLQKVAGEKMRYIFGAFDEKCGAGRAGRRYHHCGFAKQ